MLVQEHPGVRVAKVVPAFKTMEGEGMWVRRAFPNEHVGRIDPFLLLDHMGPTTYGPGEAKGAPDHPHRGFETVTLVLEGDWEHKDSRGNRGQLEAGSVQWMTAGSGVVHSELPSAKIRKEGGVVHGMQLWVNLPKRLKMTEPRYQDLHRDQIQEAKVDGGVVRVIAGGFQGIEAAASTHTPITLLHATLAAGARVTFDVAQGHNAFAYAIAGGGTVLGSALEEGLAAVLSGSGSVEVEAGAGGLQLLWASAAPINEPIFQWGPFVMNERVEILQAIQDYQSGKLGSIA